MFPFTVISELRGAPECPETLVRGSSRCLDISDSEPHRPETHRQIGLSSRKQGCLWGSHLMGVQTMVGPGKGCQSDLVSITHGRSGLRRLYMGHERVDPLFPS